MEDEENIMIQPNYNENDINLLNDLCSESSSQSVVYAKDIYVYAWGKNKYGELGINSARNAFYPSAIKSLKLSVVNSVALGGRNSMILTSEGQILVCGSNIFNLLASNSKIQNNEVYQKTFKPIKFFEENKETIKEIAIAEFHSLALNEKGEIFGWGGNLFNKLGQTNGLCGLPSKIYIKRKIVSIACGDYHSCALSENGVLYTWGGGGESYNKGQCGQGSKKDVESPKKVEFFTKKGLHIRKVSCGGYHTIVMDENNELYGFGKGIFGQCGYGQPEDTDYPRKIIFNDKNLNKIIDIKCGGEHTLFLSDIGRVYACGHGYFGQLGLGNNKNVKSPILVQSLSNKNIIEIATGWSHSLVLTDSGYVYSAGCGKFGELGLGEKKNKYNYTWIRKLGTMNIKHIFAGGHHSWCIIDDKFPLKEKLIEPEPLEKPNYRMTKRKHSVSDKDNMSFNDQTNMRNKSSDAGYFNKTNNKFKNNLANSFDDFKNKNGGKNYQNNMNTIQNNEFKRMIDDYNDKRNNTEDNIDNIIDYIDTMNSQGSKKKNTITFLNNENKESKFDYSNNKIDNYNSKNNEQNKYMSNNSEEDRNNEDINLMKNINEMNKLNEDKNFDNNIINNNEDNINSEIINEDDYLRNKFNNINDKKINIIENTNNNKYIEEKPKKIKKYSEQKNTLNLLNSKIFENSQIQLQVIYSSLNLSHRFIRFEISNTNKYYKADYNTIYNLIRNYLSSDKGNISFKIQNDNEVLKSGNLAPNSNLESIMKDMKNAGLLNLTKKDKISYTINIVYDYKQNEIMKKLYESIEEKYVYKEKNGYMNMKIIEQNQIINEGENLEGVLSKWIIDFYNKFKTLFLCKDQEIEIDEEGNDYEISNEKINKPRFFEMRPKIFQ